MALRDDLHTLPDGLPVPVDDGRCDHLPGTGLPAVALTSTGGGTVDLSTIPGTVVVYCYPRTGHPDRAMVEGWNDIPGHGGARRRPVRSATTTGRSPTSAPGSTA